MSQQLTIDCFAFAREARVLERTLPVSALERLHDVLAHRLSEVKFRLQGTMGAGGKLQLRLSVRGNLALACQRCLEAVDFVVEIDNLLELVSEDTDLSQEELEDDTRDFLPVGGPLEVVALVEDEILLALPVAPRHEKCGLPGERVAGERISPLAALAGFKGKPN
ncbi:MAG TPA: DUF177 domain-containing protein [Rhodocyclaceae bacterium]|nr:DUF177 domain-containing protein [Rhodocyclaceae bacterium]